jgi:hypothetical protein
MSLLSPKPIIAHVVRTWRVPPGLTYALVQDVQKRVWIVESCPAGTHFWTLEQAALLPQGARTRRALQEVLRLGQEWQQQNRPVPAPVAPLPNTTVAPFAELNETTEPIRVRKRARPARPITTGKSLVKV